MVDKVAAQNYQLNVLPCLIKDYHPDDIYNADETDLFYKAVPSRTYQYKDKPSDDIKVCEKRLSLLFCCNMSGTDKLKPIVIGNFENPRCFKNINKANLTAFYRYNKKAWMTGLIWLECLDKSNKQFVQ